MLRVSRVKQKLTLESIGLMSRLSRVSIALSLIAVTVNGFHVESIESNAKINIGVNGINVETVESFETITATCHFSFDNVLSLKRGKKRQKEGHPELKLYYKRQAVSNRTKKYILFSCRDCREFNQKITLNQCITCQECREWPFSLRFTMYILIQSLRITIFFELKLRITGNFELNLRITTTSN